MAWAALELETTNSHRKPREGACDLWNDLKQHAVMINDQTITSIQIRSSSPSGLRLRVTPFVMCKLSTQEASRSSQAAGSFLIARLRLWPNLIKACF